MATKPQTTEARPELARDLRLSHATAVVVGTVIGSGIFLVPAEMMQAVGSAKLVYLAWFVGGLLSVVFDRVVGDKHIIIVKEKQRKIHVKPRGNSNNVLPSFVPSGMMTAHFAVLCTSLTSSCNRLAFSLSFSNDRTGKCFK